MAVFLVGIVAAMVVTQRLRSEGPVASRIAMRSAEGAPYRVCFQTPRDDIFDLAMVDSRGPRLVHVLAEDVPLEGDSTPDSARLHCFDWDGSATTAGRLRPARIASISSWSGPTAGRLGREARITEAAPPPSAESGAEP